jgi:hypothetical protein
MARAANWGRLTCESYLAIDVREWKRRGLLRGRSVRLPALLRISLRQPAGEPAKSIHQALAKHQNAARRQPRPATALSEKAAWNAPAHVHSPSGA